MLKLAVLARTEKGFIKLTRKGKALLAEDVAGQLQATLTALYDRMLPFRI